MSEETISVVVCHEGTPSNTYTLHDTDVQTVMETIGRVISWRSMEERIAEALPRLNDGCFARGFETHLGRHVDTWDIVIVVDKTVEQDIVIRLESGRRS